MKKRVDLLEAGLLDLATKIFELEKTSGRQAEQNRAVRKTLTSLKGLLNDKGYISNDEFDEALEGYEVAKLAKELPDIHDEEHEDYLEEVCH